MGLIQNLLKYVCGRKQGDQKQSTPLSSLISTPGWVDTTSWLRGLSKDPKTETPKVETVRLSHSVVAYDVKLPLRRCPECKNNIQLVQRQRFEEQKTDDSTCVIRKRKDHSLLIYQKGSSTEGAESLAEFPMDKILSGWSSKGHRKDLSERESFPTWVSTYLTTVTCVLCGKYEIQTFLSILSHRGCNGRFFTNALTMPVGDSLERSLPAYTQEEQPLPAYTEKEEEASPSHVSL